MLATKTPQFQDFTRSASALMGMELDENWLLEVWTGADQDPNRALNWVMDTPPQVLGTHQVQWQPSTSPQWKVSTPVVEPARRTVSGETASFGFPAFDFPAEPQPQAPNFRQPLPPPVPRRSMPPPVPVPAPLPQPAPASVPVPNPPQQLALASTAGPAGITVPPMMTSEQMSAMMMQQSLAMQTMMMQTAMQSMAMQSMMTQSIMMNHPMVSSMCHPMMMHPHHHPMQSRMMHPSLGQWQHQRMSRRRNEGDDDWWSGSEEDRSPVRSNNPFTKPIARDRMRRRRQLGY
eukprot:GEMP01058033.1.p1 GENE.GEMP01058033.1~~GEMP01058033.1.p1  ORF type:complete len:290 (+),score=64.67 GEMP01058033.1:188-1057(+)